MWLYYILIFYILVLAGVIYSSNINNTQNKSKNIIYLTLLFSVFIFIASFRGKGIGNDTSNYLKLFDELKLFNLDYFLGRYEIGYLYLNKIIQIFSDNNQLILIVTSVIILIGYARFIYKYSNIVWLSVFLFFTMGYFGATMNTIRSEIAIVIILKSYDYIVKRKKMKFILTVCIASLFHSTAIIFLIAYPISKLKLNYKIEGVFLVGNIILYNIFNPLLNIILQNTRFRYYLETKYLNGQIRLASILNLGVNISIFLLVLYILRKYIDNNEDEGIKIMSLLSLISISIYVVSLKFNLLDRVAEYFSVVNIVYLPNVISRIKIKKSINIILFMVIILFTLYFSIIQYYKPEWNIIYPYRFFWS